MRHFWLSLGLVSGLTLLMASSVPAGQPSHGLSLYGPQDLKYQPGEPYRYANPKAPKGGLLTLNTLGAFTKLNPISLKGVPTPFVDMLVFQTPMDGSMDDSEHFSQYGNLVEKVELADDRYWDDIHRAMGAVMNTPRGTGWATSLGAGYKMAGKSGSAQVFSVGQEEEYDEEEIDERLRDHALFVAFAPMENPQIAISVLVENGGSGGRAAGPVVRRVFDAWFEEHRQ